MDLRVLVSFFVACLFVLASASSIKTVEDQFAVSRNKRSDEEIECNLALERYQPEMKRCVSRQIKLHIERAGSGYTQEVLCNKAFDVAEDCFSQYTDAACKNVKEYGEVKRLTFDLLKAKCLSSGAHRISTNNFLIFTLFALILKGFMIYH